MKTKVTKKEQKAKYAFGTYKASKNAVAIKYKGKTYLSKKQCMVLNDLSRTQLELYLNEQK